MVKSGSVWIGRPGWRSWVLLLVSTLIVGCVKDKPYFVPDKSRFLKEDTKPNLFRQGTCEVRKKSSELCGNYDLAVIELDDWGQLRRGNQLDDARDLIREIRAELEDDLSRKKVEKDALTLVFFTHGWKHYATNMVCKGKQVEEPRECRSDLERFRIFLRDLSAQTSCQRVALEEATSYHEKALADLSCSHVVGVFLTWKGVPIRRDNWFFRAVGFLPNFFSFWSRDRAAERIGGSGAAYMDVIHDLSNLARKRVNVACRPDSGVLFPNHVRKVVSEKACVEKLLEGTVGEKRGLSVLPKTTVIAIGHSFGGKITELGLGPSLVSATKGRSALAATALVEAEQIKTTADNSFKRSEALNILAESEQRRILTLGREVGRFSERLGSMNSGPWVAAKIDSLSERIQLNEKRVAALKKRLKPLEGREKELISQKDGKLDELTALAKSFVEKVDGFREHLKRLKIWTEMDQPLRAPWTDGEDPKSFVEKHLESLCKGVTNKVARQRIFGTCRSARADVVPELDWKSWQLADLEGRFSGVDASAEALSKSAEELEILSARLNEQSRWAGGEKQELEQLNNSSRELESELRIYTSSKAKAEPVLAKLACREAELKETIREEEQYLSGAQESRQAWREGEANRNWKVSEALPNPFDLVLLINPAAPSIRALELRDAFENVDPELRSRRDNLHKPMVVSISSKTDWATDLVFPAAKSLALGHKHIGMKGDRRRALTRVAPHRKQLVDFDLCCRDANGDCPQETRKPTCATKPSDKEEKPLFVSSENGKEPLDYWLFPRRDEVGPYWVIDEQASLIRGHSDALSDRTMQILIGLLGRANAFELPKLDEEQEGDGEQRGENDAEAQVSSLNPVINAEDSHVETDVSME